MAPGGSSSPFLNQLGRTNIRLRISTGRTQRVPHLKLEREIGHMVTIPGAYLEERRARGPDVKAEKEDELHDKGTNLGPTMEAGAGKRRGGESKMTRSTAPASCFHADPPVSRFLQTYPLPDATCARPTLMLLPASGERLCLLPSTRS